MQAAGSERTGRQAERQTGRQDTSRTCSCHTDADIPALQVDFIARAAAPSSTLALDAVVVVVLGGGGGGGVVVSW